MMRLPFGLGRILRRVITAAIETIDRILKNDAEEAGESRTEGRRIAFELPMGVAYKVFPSDRRVRVLAAWHVAKKSR